MIAFMTLCYCAILATLVRLKVVKLNLWWKLSPVLFFLVCLVLLVLPMQWGCTFRDSQRLPACCGDHSQRFGQCPPGCGATTRTDETGRRVVYH